jgi:hypothetical protein
MVGDPFLHSTSFLALLLLDGSQAGDPMRIPIAVLVISAGIVVVDGVVARAESRDVPAVRVRVYDYAGIVPETLTEAQSVAATFYTAIDVAIDWAPTMGPRARKRSDVENGRLQDFTIIVLSRSMVARRAWPPGAIGSAAVAPEGGGRIAYVLYDRLKDAAAAAGWQDKELLAVVMAHELAHLLLPPGSHSSDGLMRKGWDVAELRHLHASSLAFTPNQTALIRARLGEVVAAR